MDATLLRALLGGTASRWLKRPLWLGVKALTGMRLQSPVRFQDLGIWGGYFEARAAKVSRRLPPGFQVTERRNGWTELKILAIQYRQVDILAPYLEVAIQVPVRYNHTARDAQFVLHMPVTTEEARWTGVENFGFPKFVADIRVQPAESGVSCTLEHRYQRVFELQVDPVPAQRVFQQDRNLTVRDDEVVVQSRFDLEGVGGLADRPGSARLRLGYHEIADQLRQMDVKRTGRAFWLPQASATLSTGEVLGPLSRIDRGSAPSLESPVTHVAA